MHPIILATFVTLLILLLDIRAKCRKPSYKYVAVFFLVAGIGFFFRGMQAEASEIQDYHRCLRSQDEGIHFTIENKNPRKTKKEIQEDFIKTCWQKANYHYEEGCRYLAEAEEVALLFPEIPDFDKSKLCLVNLVAALIPGEPTYRLIGVTLTIVGQYALLFLDEWNKFKNLLLHSKTHFEMEEHYRIIGKYQYDLYRMEKKEAEIKKTKKNGK